MARFKQIFPSVMSGSRLLISIIFPFCSEWLQLWLILAAGASDLADGWLARRWKSVSWQGGLIDAFADKVFVLTVLFVFLAKDRFSSFWIPVVLSRDLIVLFAAGYGAVCGRWDIFRRMKPRIAGKLATGGQFLLFVIILLLPEMTLPALVFVSLCCVFSAMDYGRLFIAELLRVSRARAVNRK